MALSDLYQLGPCLASVLPNSYLSQMDPSTFVNYYTTLGNVFQPDNTQITSVQTLISSYASNTSVVTSQDTLAFSTLSDLALYYPFSTYSNSLTLVIIIL